MSQVIPSDVARDGIPVPEPRESTLCPVIVIDNTPHVDVLVGMVQDVNYVQDIFLMAPLPHLGTRLYGSIYKERRRFNLFRVSRNLIIRVNLKRDRFAIIAITYSHPHFDPHIASRKLSHVSHRDVPHYLAAANELVHTSRQDTQVSSQFKSRAAGDNLVGDLGGVGASMTLSLPASAASRA
ncbi:MAG: hypothetical protein ABI391_02770 [Hyphomicrobiaceae bacterium]